MTSSGGIDMCNDRASSPVRLAALAIVLAVSVVPVCQATTHNVSATSSLSFVPANITINVGDSVTWTNTTGGYYMHNVVADDGSFRCANGCDGDGHGGNGNPATTWTFTLTFNQAGTVNYHCEVHGGPPYYMMGSITVQGASTPGTLGFTTAAYSQAETGGHATITLQRTGGSSGTVGVDYATSSGTAVAGTNYTPASGTLTWAAGDTSQKSFNVPVIDDGVQDGTHTVNLTLSNATGGASVGQASAVLSITDNDKPAAAGSLAFSAAAYSVAENAGTTSITVNRSGGSSGAVSAHYATSNGTGMAGKHYTATSGTLNWGAGDSAAKTFSVAVLDDGVADGNHTANLTLSAPQGGASLGTPSSAVLTITNTDGGTGGAPAAPSNLAAASAGTTAVNLTWKSNSNNETGFRVQSKVLDGSPFQDVLPLSPAGSAGTAVTGLLPATGYGFRVRAENAAGASAYTTEADAATDTTPGTCVADANTLCLGGRFKVSVAWATSNMSGVGTTVPLAANPDSGLFYFFASSNIEMLIKVINGCGLSNTYWVFFAATTNVQFTVTVVDVTTGKTKVYFNPLNQAAAPVQDTNAFATCP
jgi:plastocyanin